LELLALNDPAHAFAFEAWFLAVGAVLVGVVGLSLVLSAVTGRRVGLAQWLAMVLPAI